MVTRCMRRRETRVASGTLHTNMWDARATQLAQDVMVVLGTPQICALRHVSYSVVIGFLQLSDINGVDQWLPIARVTYQHLGFPCTI